MSEFDPQRDEDFTDVIQRLRDHRPEVTGLELDRIKLRALASATSSRQKGSVVKSRITVALLSLGLMVGGTSGVIAAKGGNSNKGSAGKSQYSNGKKCGNPNGGPKKPNQKPCPPRSPAGGG